MSEIQHSTVISSLELAKWLDGQPGSWWNVDGDPLLTSEMDFPCPNDELAEALGRVNKEIIVFMKERRRAPGTVLHSADLDDVADTDNPRKQKTFLAAWKGSDVQWLLTEDKSMAELVLQTAMESTDAAAAN